MSAHASGTFTVKAWDEKPIAEMDGGGKLTRASVAGVYTGDIEGEGKSEVINCYRADGTAVFVGIERIVGRVGGRTGSFVLQTSGAFDGEEAKATLSVLSGSSTGDLAGLEGEGRFAASRGQQGKLELDYRPA
jgi:hypothetical protein